MPELSYEAIADGLNVCTSQWHRFGTDAVLLAEFSAYRRKERVCDLGTGCGIIPMLMQRKDAPQEIYGVDIQPEAIDQMRRGMAASTGIRSRMHPVCADLKTLWEGAPLGQLDLVTCNPPYKAYQAGLESQLTAQKIARHEVLCNIGDICLAALHLQPAGTAGGLHRCHAQSGHRTQTAAICGKGSGCCAVALSAGGQKRRKAVPERSAPAHHCRRKRCDNTSDIGGIL